LLSFFVGGVQGADDDRITTGCKISFCFVFARYLPALRGPHLLRAQAFPL